MPADSVVPAPMGTVTHALTIDAPPQRVWPWLAQMGAGRAGWYSFVLVEPPHDLALAVPDASGGMQVSWEFLLEPLDGGRTRLILRGRLSRRWPAPAQDRTGSE
jgi:uncharacterized protein YndB with AHSA1/START domain